MTPDPSDPGRQHAPAPDDTAAFQRFYFDDAPASGRSWWYRVLVGWWRRDRGA